MIIGKLLKNNSYFVINEQNAINPAEKSVTFINTLLLDYHSVH